MKKVLHILSQIPDYTGSGVYLRNMTQQAERAGWHQQVLLGLPVSQREMSVPGVPDAQVHRVLFESPELPFLIPGMSDVMPYPSLQFSQMTPDQLKSYQQAFRQAIAFCLETFQPDVILSNHLWLVTGLAAEFISEVPISKRPKIFGICHGTDLRQMIECPHLGTMVIPYLPSLDGIFCLTEKQAEELTNTYSIPPERLFVTHSGYDNTLFYPAPQKKMEPDAPIHLVYAGKLSDAKGVWHLIQAVNLLSPQSFKLSIAGTGMGPEAERILSAIKGSRVPITYWGHLSQLALADLFRQGDIFVLPSFFEGLSLVAIEALASGMTVVSNDLPGLHSWIDSNPTLESRIHFIKAPRLIGADQCHPEDRDPYIQRLAQQILQTKRPLGPDPKISAALRPYSWQTIFQNLSKHF